MPAQTVPTIGDRLTGPGVDWAWYSGGWSNADGDVGAPGWTNGAGPADADRLLRPERRPRGVRRTGRECPDNLFQYHHQPFNYFANFTPGHGRERARTCRTRPSSCSRASLDEQDCNLKPVSFVKPIGRRTSIPATPASRTGATTSSTC